MPGELSEDVFWIRYFFRVYQINQEEEQRKAVLSGKVHFNPPPPFFFSLPLFSELIPRIRLFSSPSFLVFSQSFSLRCTDLRGRPDMVMAGITVKSRGRPRYPSSHDAPKRAHKAAHQQEEAAADATLGVTVFVDEYQCIYFSVAAALLSQLVVVCKLVKWLT